jgi:hypothetical protein
VAFWFPYCTVSVKYFIYIFLRLAATLSAKTFPCLKLYARRSTLSKWPEASPQGTVFHLGAKEREIKPWHLVLPDVPPGTKYLSSCLPSCGKNLESQQ